MDFKFILIVTLIIIIVYWYHQYSTDLNESYKIPYEILNKNEKTFSLKSIKIKKNLFSNYRYTIGINKKDFKDNDEWKKKIQLICKEMQFSKNLKKKIIKNIENSKNLSIGASINNDNIVYKIHIWYNFDTDSDKVGIRYDYNVNTDVITTREYSFEKNISGELINKQIIKYSTYDINLYNLITNMISDILNSPLREEVSSPLILYSKGDSGLESITFRLDDYNAKIKQIQDHILKISEYLNQKKNIEKWIKEENDMMLAGISFGFDIDKKFYFKVHNYAIH